MKNAPIHSISNWRQLYGWCLPIFVVLFLSHAVAQESCDLAVQNHFRVSKSATLDEVWQTLVSENRVDGGLLIARPEPTRTLYLTHELSLRIKEWLEQKGYQAELVQLETRTDLTHFVPTRWALKIIHSPNSTWVGRVLSHSMKKTEVEYFFDPYGLFRNSSEGSADFVGHTQISFGIKDLKKWDADFIDSLLHEIHHASNHKKLKNQDPSGIYAEVNSVYNSTTQSRHKFSEQYPNYFHFDELAAFSKEIAQTKSKLKQLHQQSSEFAALKVRLDQYMKMYEALYHQANQVLDLAASTFSTQAGRRETKFFIDRLHRNATAHLYLKKEGESENSFIFTIWTPGITRLDHDAKSYKAVRKEILLLKEKLEKMKSKNSSI